jgi:starvation-inducible outer membrane lipoprotein
MIKRFIKAAAGIMLVLCGCSTYQVIPDRLEGLVRKDVRLAQVEDAPASYQGQTVVWGGEILDVSRRGENTSLEILHLPLDRTLRPVVNPPASEGRFLAIDAHGDITDADKLKKGTLVTVIGTVQGLVSTKQDKDSHGVPALLIRDMTAWNRQVGRTTYPPGSPFIGYRPFIFWDSRRVAGQ